MRCHCTVSSFEESEPCQFIHRTSLRCSFVGMRRKEFELVQNVSLAGCCLSWVWQVIFPSNWQDFSGEALTPFFGDHLIHFLDFRNFVLHNCILIFDAEQVYSKLQVTNLKNKEVTVNPRPQTLGKKSYFSKPQTPNPKPQTLNPKHQIRPKP